MTAGANLNRDGSFSQGTVWNEWQDTWTGRPTTRTSSRTELLSGGRGRGGMRRVTLRRL